MPVTRKLKPLISDQVSAGFYYNLMRSYSFSVEGYYKWMKNLLDYKDGYSFLPGTAAWEEKMAVGKGRSYGRGVLGSQGKRTYDRLDRIYTFMVGSAFR